MAQKPRLIPTARGWITPPDVARSNRSLQNHIDKGFRCFACGRLFTPSRPKAKHTARGKECACVECARDFD